MKIIAAELRYRKKTLCYDINLLDKYNRKISIRIGYSSKTKSYIPYEVTVDGTYKRAKLRQTLNESGFENIKVTKFLLNLVNKINRKILENDLQKKRNVVYKV